MAAGSIIIDGSRWEPGMDITAAKKAGVVSAIFCLNIPGSYDLNNPGNQGGVATTIDPAFYDHCEACLSADLPIELYFNWNYTGDLEGGFSKTHYMHDWIIAALKGIAFKAIWLSLEYNLIWRGAVSSQMTPQNLRAGMEQMRSLAQVKWPTRPWGVYSSINLVKTYDIDPNTKQDSLQIQTWLINQLNARMIRWWAAFYPTLPGFDPAHIYTPEELLVMLSSFLAGMTSAAKAKYLYLGNNSPHVWQFNDRALSDFVRGNAGEYTAGDWDWTGLDKLAYWFSVNFEEQVTPPPPDTGCPAGQHKDPVTGLCVPDVTPPPPDNTLAQILANQEIIKLGITKVNELLGKHFLP